MNKAFKAKPLVWNDLGDNLIESHPIKELYFIIWVDEFGMFNLKINHEHPQKSNHLNVLRN